MSSRIVPKLYLPLFYFTGILELKSLRFIHTKISKNWRLYLLLQILFYGSHNTESNLVNWGSQPTYFNYMSHLNFDWPALD